MKKKIIIISSIVLALALAGGGSWWLFKKQRNLEQKPTNTTTITDNQGENINLGPPSDEQKRIADERKKTLGQDPTPAPTTPSNKTKVTPVITNASVSGINSYVPGIFEEGGTCTATFTKSGQSFSRSSTGFQNATNTGCPPITTTRSDFPSTGSWSVTLSYSSAKSEGSSPSKTFDVQ